jgi:hypothetical protein
MNVDLDEQERVEWYTPHDLAVCIRTFFYHPQSPDVNLKGFLDAASCEQANLIVKANFFFSKDRDALDPSNSWKANCVYLNPPSSRGLQVKSFVTKMLEQYKVGNFAEGLLLVRVATDAKWFKPLHQYPICYLKTLHFVDGNKIAAKRSKKKSRDNCPRALVYLGKRYSASEFLLFFKEWSNM